MIMKNKITFFRFENSKIGFSENEFLENQNNLKKISSIRQDIKELKSLRKTNEDGNQRTNDELLLFYVKLKLNMENHNNRHNNEYNNPISKRLEGNFFPAGERHDFYKTMDTSDEYFFESDSISYNSINSNYELLNMLDTDLNQYLIAEITNETTQKKLVNLISLLEKKEANLNENILRRIEVKEINKLNSEIEKMNAQGWQIKQIQNIESGKYSAFSDGGYGYSFTEGILIVWESQEKKNFQN